MLQRSRGSAGASPYLEPSRADAPRVDPPHADSSHPVSGRLDQPYPKRRKPAEGVHIYSGQPRIVFVTVCTKDRARWLACDEAHRLLSEIWRQADAWLVGGYVLMPDHLHLFAAPRDLHFTLEQWIVFWKSQFSKSHTHPEWLWQANSFHHRLRHDESYAEKRLYARENPVRAGLADGIGEWPYQGTIHELRC